MQQLGSCDPEALASEDEKLALACNAYNAFVMNGVISHKITDSVDGFTVDGTGFFDLKEHIYAGETISLNDLEQNMNSSGLQRAADSRRVGLRGSQLPRHSR